MTDARQKAEEDLMAAGFKPVDRQPHMFYRSRGDGAYGRAIVPFKGNNYYVELRGPIAELRSALAPRLTDEDFKLLRDVARVLGICDQMRIGTQVQGLLQRLGGGER